MKVTVAELAAQAKTDRNLRNKMIALGVIGLQNKYSFNFIEARQLEIAIYTQEQVECQKN